MGWNKVYHMQNTGFNLLGKKLSNNGDRVENIFGFRCYPVYPQVGKKQNS